MDLDDGSTPLRYSVRTSARARYAHLTVSPRDGVVVVVPRRFDVARVPAIVKSRAEWIRRAEQRIAEARASIVEDDPASDGRPELVQLRAIGERWRVTYETVAIPRTTVRPAGEVLHVVGAVADPAAVEPALGRWLTTRARQAIGPWLGRLAIAQGVEITGMSVRAQRSRWASCSSTGRVSINRTLLFLPPPLAEHVLLHELCHRRDLSHSPRFWELLAACDPAALRHREEMRSAWKYVPSWAQR